MKWFSLLSVIFMMLATLLFASPVAYADDPPDEDSDTVIDIGIDGDLEVDIEVRGPAELNVGVEGPSQVHIDAGDEVGVNIEASDESQVFLDDHSLDNPAQKPDEPAQGSVVPVISGVFPAAGLLAFLLIRRRAKNNIDKKDTQLAKPGGKEVKK
ncbi:MAG TPA: hypothetical protein G4N91_00470 [Dehalococcoidia bacterium]|nr:hypothetical protein [Dehalococcoidia bacterium]